MDFRKRKRFSLVIGVLALSLLIAAAIAVPPDMERDGGIALSHPSGFYDEPFYLEITGGGSIYYTLDGSEPDETSLRYTGPILIDDASKNPNVFSMIPEVSLYYDRELLEERGISDMYEQKLPSQNVDKATIINAVSIDALGNRSVVASAVYFVGFEDKPGYDGINIISIQMDPGDLFDFEKGIYVTGKVMADAVASQDPAVTRHDTYLWLWPANYNQRGSEWERKARIICFDADRDQTLSGSFGVRIQGRWSRASMPKSMNIFARKAYGAKTIDCAPLIGLDEELTSLNLNSGGNDIDTMITDYLANALLQGYDISCREYSPYALFLDGEYWGVFWLTPRFKADYLSKKYGVAEDNVIIVKGRYVEAGDEHDIDLFKSMQEFISETDMSDPEAYAKACEMIDIENCVDYYATEIYIANMDWPVNNYSLWRTRSGDFGQYEDTRWRWLLFDLNASMNPDNANMDSVERARNEDALFQGLMGNEEFARAIEERLVYLAGNVFTPERVDPLITEYENDMAEAIGKKYQRFYDGDKTEADFLEACEEVRAFFRLRRDYIMSAYGEADE